MPPPAVPTRSNGTFSYDGTTFNAEADGPGLFTRTYSQGPSSATVALNISIGSGELVLIQEIVTVHNVPPSVDAGPDLTAASGDQVTLSASFTDPGTGDTHTATIDWGDGTVTVRTVGTDTYNSVGIFSVTVTVTDNDGDSGKDSLNIRIGNALPVAQDDSTTVAEGGSVAVSVLANDSDPENDALTITAVTQGTNGTTAISGDSITYIHDRTETTSDSFIYTISDGNGGTDTVTITPGNDPPVATGDTATVLEGGSVAITVLANDSDPDGDILTITGVTQGTNGTVAISGDGVTYTHDGSETTSDSFAYTISDGKGGIDTASVTITVTPVNDPPVAQIDSATVVEGGPVVGVLANDSDPDGDTLTITAVTQGANGTVAISGDSITYAHDGSQTTSDAFAYTISDSNGGSDTATVPITVTPVNDPPVATADAATVLEGGSVAIVVLANDSDPEQDTLTITAVTQGANGTATITGTNVTYAHNGSKTTFDSFTYTISDGSGSTDTAAVFITVIPVNDSPVAQNDADTVAEAGSVVISVLANDTDADQGTLTVIAVTQGANGTVISAGSTVTYTHNGSETTTDTFTYTISDGRGGTDTATVTITVTLVNDSPVAQNDAASVARRASVVVGVLANDSDSEGETLTITTVTQGANGSVTTGGGSVTYTHNGSATTTDTFTYTIIDGNGGTDTATVSVTITTINSPPVAANDTATVGKGGSVVVNVLANDSDPDLDTLTIIAVTQGTNGSVVNNGTSVTYTHNGSLTAADSFAYTISDGKGGTDTATVTITITTTNSPPVAANDTATVGKGGSVVVNVLANDSDPDLDTLTIIAVTQGTNGSVVNNGTSVTYTHNGSLTAADSFAYTISDGKGGTDTATVSITVTPVNDPPVAVADTGIVAEGGTVVISVLANDSDPEGNTLAITAVTQGANGSIISNGTTVTYTHNGSATTSDSLTYTVSDNLGGFATATVTITVTPVNDPPVATADTATVPEGGAVVVQVLANDSDAENDTLTIIAVTQGANGSVTNNGTSLTYTHDGSETTSDTFTYTVSDGNGGFDTATVSITVIPVNDPPVAVNDSASVAKGGRYPQKVCKQSGGVPSL